MSISYQDCENENHRVSCERVESLPVFVDEVFVFDFAGHHDKRFHDRGWNVDIEALQKNSKLSRFITKTHSLSKIMIWLATTISFRITHVL